LRQVFIFTELGEKELANVLEITRVFKYRKGEVIFFEGDPGEALYFVCSGKVKIYKLTPDGREHILHIIRPGGVFAEVVFFDPGPYPASAEAMNDSRVGSIRRDDFDRVLRDNPSIAVKMLGLMSMRLREAQAKIRDLALRDTYGRMVGTLLRLAGEHGTREGKLVRLGLKLTHQELANMMGASRETVTRLLNGLRKQGIIDIDRRSIVILDVERLVSTLSGEEIIEMSAGASTRRRGPGPG